MTNIVFATLAVLLCFAAEASAQPNVTFDSPFQVRTATKIKKGDLLNITNTGATNTNLCAHVYAFDGGGQMLACCSCVVAPNALRSLSVGTDVFEGAKPPKSGIFKVLASTVVGGTCNGAAPGALSTGLVASRNDLSFIPATLSAGELTNLQMRCLSLHAVANICPLCR